MAQPIATKSVALKAQDPIAILISAIVQTASQLGAFAAIGLDADGVASLLSGLLAVAAIVRMMLEQKREADLKAIAAEISNAASAAKTVVEKIQADKTV